MPEKFYIHQYIIWITRIGPEWIRGGGGRSLGQEAKVASLCQDMAGAGKEEGARRSGKAKEGKHRRDAQAGQEPSAGGEARKTIWRWRRRWRAI